MCLYVHMSKVRGQLVKVISGARIGGRHPYPLSQYDGYTLPPFLRQELSIS